LAHPVRVVLVFMDPVIVNVIVFNQHYTVLETDAGTLLVDEVVTGVIRDQAGRVIDTVLSRFCRPLPWPCGK